MDAIANQRYQSIRHQLDTLHYSQPFNIESCALVERLITDLLKTTEAYQKVKNEFAIITNENKLNQQALMPLQKENERLSKESNLLHFDIIRAKEELDQLDLKWKSALRQLQNECQDLRFLVDQKDVKIKQQDQELTRMKGKFEKVLSKMYVSTQDEVIQRLAPDITDREETNVLLKGRQQNFQMSAPLERYNNDISEMVNDDSFHQPTNNPGHEFNQAELNNKQWAEELTKADERSQTFMAQLQEQKASKREVEDRLQALEKQITVREQEIQRLHNVYEGGQNLEKLNVRFVHETNEKTIAKLQNQLEFVNKENHRLTQQINFLKGGKTVLDEIQTMKKEITDITFENQTLRKDLQECSKLVADYQEREVVSKLKEREIAQEEKVTSKELENKLQEVKNEHEKLKQEYERVQSLRGAYNADKKVLVERISELEATLTLKEQDKDALSSRYGLLDQSAGQYRNEINFLNGKCSTLKRDLEYSERYLQKYKDENTKLGQENDYLKSKMDQMDREGMLMKKQVNGLQEDNDRINRLYQVVEKEAFTQNSYKKQHDQNFQEKEEKVPKKAGYANQPTPKNENSKWKVVEDDFGPYTASFSHRSEVDENKITVKRH